MDFSFIHDKVFNKEPKVITANVMCRGTTLGLWTGTSWEFSELTNRLKGSDVHLVVLKKE